MVARYDLINACRRVDLTLIVFGRAENKRQRKSAPAPISKKNSYLPSNNQKYAEESRYIGNQRHLFGKSNETDRWQRDPLGQGV